MPMPIDPSASGEIRNGRHVLPIRIYYEDTDFSGFVYHASYLRFMERGRTEYLRLLGVAQGALFGEAQAQALGLAFVVRTMRIEFLRTAAMDDVVEVWTVPGEVRGASITLEQRVVRAGERLVEATVRVAFVGGGKAQRIPKALRDAMGADLDRTAGPDAGSEPSTPG